MKTVLIVDDSPGMRKMIGRCLRDIPDIQIAEADSGLTAVECLGLRSIDLMTLDLEMPELDGAAVTQFVRSLERFKRLPIVMITTRVESVLRSTLLAQGVSHYITKPFNPEELVGIVRQMLESNPDVS